MPVLDALPLLLPPATLSATLPSDGAPVFGDCVDSTGLSVVPGNGS